jgi:hypothetical protein
MYRTINIKELETQLPRNLFPWAETSYVLRVQYSGLLAFDDSSVYDKLCRSCILYVSITESLYIPTAHIASKRRSSHVSPGTTFLV